MDFTLLTKYQPIVSATLPLYNSAPFTAWGKVLPVGNKPWGSIQGNTVLDIFDYKLLFQSPLNGCCLQMFAEAREIYVYICIYINIYI